MPDIFYPKTEQDVSDFIFDNYNKSNPIEIVGYGSKKIGRLIQSSQTLSLSSMSGILGVFSRRIIHKGFAWNITHRNRDHA